MNHEHIKAILEGVIPEVKAAITAAQKPLLDRIEQIEAKEPEVILVKGPQGDSGRDGVDGSAGPSGERGLPGERGPPGEISPAPDDVADQIASTIAMLAESPAIQRSVNAAAPSMPRPRSFTFERDETGKVVAAHEGEDA